jgi:NAD(P)H dehydrogenase (quinone)
VTGATAGADGDALGGLVGVTGATGQLGGRVARRLAAAGAPQRLVVRDAARAPSLPGAQVAVATYADGDALRRALEGVGTLLLVSASESADRVAEHRSAVDAAVAAGVRHVVYTSFVGAAPDATFTLARDHAATEEHLAAAARAVGVTWTVLRDCLYADVLPDFVGDDGVLRGPAGDGRVAAVARDDVADAAVAVLRDPAAHAGRTYDLTGPAALTLAEVAETLTAAGRPARYLAETVDEAFASRAGTGAPDWQLRAWVSTYTAVAAGEMARVTGDVTALTGRPATTLADVVAGLVGR